MKNKKYSAAERMKEGGADKYMQNKSGEFLWLFNWVGGGFNEVWAKTKKEAIEKVKEERREAEKRNPNHARLEADSNSFRKATLKMSLEQDAEGRRMTMAEGGENVPPHKYNFEIYTKNPKTGEKGWDIKFVSVFASSKEEAKKKLKDFPNFDTIILYNYSHPITLADRDYIEEGYDFIEETHPYAKMKEGGQNKKVGHKMLTESEYWRVQGTGLLGYVDTTYDHLVKKLGKPTYESTEDDKTRAEWDILFDDGAVATIYDYNSNKPLKKETDWHIGGINGAVVERVGHILNRLTKLNRPIRQDGGEAMPEMAQERFDEDIVLNSLIAYKEFLHKSIKYFESHSIETIISKELKQEHTNVETVIAEKKGDSFDVNKHLAVTMRALCYYESKLQTKIDIFSRMGEFGEEFVDLFVEELIDVENKIEEIAPEMEEELTVEGIVVEVPCMEMSEETKRQIEQN